VGFEVQGKNKLGYHLANHVSAFNHDETEVVLTTSMIRKFQSLLYFPVNAAGKS